MNYSRHFLHISDFLKNARPRLHIHYKRNNIHPQKLYIAVSAAPGHR